MTVFAACPRITRGRYSAPGDTMRRPAALACFLASLFVAAGASAQDRPLGQFSVLRYSPAPGANNYFQVDGAAVRGDPEFAAGAMLDYAHEPFVLYRGVGCNADGSNCDAGER